MKNATNYISVSTLFIFVLSLGVLTNSVADPLKTPTQTETQSEEKTITIVTDYIDPSIPTRKLTPQTEVQFTHSKTEYFLKTKDGKKTLVDPPSPLQELKYNKDQYTNHKLPPKNVRTLAVILVQTEDNLSAPGSFQVEGSGALRNMIFTGPSSQFGNTNRFYLEDTDQKISFKGHLNPQGDFFGLYTIPSLGGNCADLGHIQYGDALQNSVTPYAIADGFNDSNYDHVMFIFPGAGCDGIGGWADIGGKYSWIQGGWHGTVIHELGHNLGLHHANFLSCKNALGEFVPISQQCTNHEYGDPFSLMGGKYFHFNNIEKNYLGVYPSSKILTIDQLTEEGQEFILAPASGPTSSAGYQLVKIHRGNGEYFSLESRQTFGVYDTFSKFDTISKGILIRLQTFPGATNDILPSSRSYLLDMHPPILPTRQTGDSPVQIPTLPGGNTLMQRAPLPVSGNFLDPLSGVKITNLEKLGNGRFRVKAKLVPIVCENPLAYQLEWVHPEEAFTSLQAGESKTVSVRVTNNNLIGCTNTSQAHFNFATPLLSPFTITTAGENTNFTLSSGQSIEIPITLTGSTTATQFGTTEHINLIQVTLDEAPLVKARLTMTIDFIPADCMRADPTASVTPSAIQVPNTAPHFQASYTITNHDSNSCPDRSFQIGPHKNTTSDYNRTPSWAQNITLSAGQASTYSFNYTWPTLSPAPLGSKTIPIHLLWTTWEDHSLSTPISVHILPASVGSGLNKK